MGPVYVHGTRGGKEGMHRGMRKLWGVDVFIFMDCTDDLMGDSYVKAHQSVSLNM